MTTTDTIGPFRFSIPSVAEAERRLNMKLGQIIAEIQSEDGMGLRTLVALVAAGSPPKGPATLMDTAASSWMDLAMIDAAKLIKRHGTAATAAAVGPAFGTFLVSIQ
jgi:hypothetical protein